jgi:hypothetical protein
MRSAICLFILLPSILASTVTLQLGGQVESFSNGTSKFNFDQTSINGITYPITSCGCTSLADKQSMCADIIHDGHAVQFFSSTDCTGPVNYEFKGPASEVHTCGFWTWESSSISIACPATSEEIM